MQVYTGLYIPEPGAGLQLSGEETTDWKSPTSEAYSRRWIVGVNILDAGSLES